MSCINHSKILPTNDKIIQAKFNKHIQRVTKLQLLLDKEERQVIAFLKLNKQALNNDKLVNFSF